MIYIYNEKTIKDLLHLTRCRNNSEDALLARTAAALHAPNNRWSSLRRLEASFGQVMLEGMSAGKISVGANIGSTPRLVYFLQMRPFSCLPLIDQKILHHHFRMIHLGLQPQIPELPCQLLQPPLLLVLLPAGFENRRVRPRDRLNITYLTCIEPHVRPGQSE